MTLHYHVVHYRNGSADLQTLDAIPISTYPDGAYVKWQVMPVAPVPASIHNTRVWRVV